MIKPLTIFPSTMPINIAPSVSVIATAAPTITPVDFFQMQRVRGTFPIRAIATSVAFAAANLIASAAQAYSIEDHLRTAPDLTQTVSDPRSFFVVGLSIALGLSVLVSLVLFRSHLARAIRFIESKITWFRKKKDLV